MTLFKVELATGGLSLTYNQSSVGAYVRDSPEQNKDKRHPYSHYLPLKNSILEKNLKAVPRNEPRHFVVEIKELPEDK